MKALVTGGAGFIGSNLIEAIVDDFEVTILDNLQTGSLKNLEAVRDMKIIEKSSNDCLSLDLKPDVIFHLGIPSSSPMYKNSPLLVGEAINGMISILELARQSGNAKVVFASSSSLYNGVPAPQSEDAVIQVTDYYTEARLAMERLAQLYSRLFEIEYAAMRFFSVYGPHEEAKGKYANIITQFFWEMKAGRSPLIFGDGSQTRDFIHVDDIVAALILASKKGSGIFNVGTGKAHSFNEVVSLLNSKLGTDLKATYRDNPIKNYVMHTQADTTKAKSLGFEAKVSLDEGIRRIS
ncbi:MAG TPA: NAD-dependent epimerase/dehydratase family protein [Methanothrix sp.]|nr:NAD-dependent epimerase/dehydratase family protein [Methanothrix sp.]